MNVFKVFEDQVEHQFYGVLLIGLLSIYSKVSVTISAARLTALRKGCSRQTPEGELWPRVCPSALQGQNTDCVNTSMRLRG